MDRAREMKTVIGECIGWASMCWDPIPSGVFDSSRAGEAVDRLENYFNSTLAQLERENAKLKAAVEAARVLSKAKVSFEMPINGSTKLDFPELDSLKKALRELDAGVGDG